MFDDDAPGFGFCTSKAAMPPNGAWTVPLAVSCELLTHFTVNAELPSKTTQFGAKPVPLMVMEAFAPAVTEVFAELITGMPFSSVTTPVAFLVVSATLVAAMVTEAGITEGAV